MMKKLGFAVAAAFAFGATAGNAAVVSYEGNDCSGEFGQGFENCVSPTGSPIIIKFNADGTVDEINSLFGSITGDEFSFGFDEGTTSAGSWMYTPGENDPAVTGYVAKGGNGFNYFDADEITFLNGVYSGSWFTTEGGLSHLSFYDTKLPEVPVPAAGFLLLAGLGGLAALKRRKKA